MQLDPVHGRVLDGKGGARAPTDAELGQGRSDDGVLWLHLDYAADSTKPWLASVAGLDEVTIEALTSDDPRPRSVVVGTGMFVVLRGVNVNDGDEPEDMVSLRMWVDAHCVITLRRRKIAAIQDVLAQLEQGSGPLDSGDMLRELTDRLLDRIGQLVRQIEDTVDELEEQVLTAEGREIRSRLSDMRRQSISLRRYVAPQREMLGRLHAERVPWLTELDRARLRESDDRVTRYLETLDSARERAAVTYEELSNRLAEQMNRTMYTLSIVAAIFLPLGLLTGLLGINVGGMPGTDSHLAFAVVTGLLVVLGTVEWLWFKRRSMF